MAGTATLTEKPPPAPDTTQVSELNPSITGFPKTFPEPPPGYQPTSGVTPKPIPTPFATPMPTPEPTPPPFPTGEGVKTGPYDFKTGQQIIGKEGNKVVVQESRGFQELVDSADVMLRKVQERLGPRAERIDFIKSKDGKKDKILVTFGTGQTAEYPVE